MKINELEKIIEKLRYYGVDKKIENISEYLQNLTQTEIDNILSMNYEKHVNVNAKMFDYSVVFKNHKLLNSSEFKKILDIILVEFSKKYNKSKDIAGPQIYTDVISKYERVISFDVFYEILESNVAWNGGYIFDDIEKIYNKISQVLDMISNLSFRRGYNNKNELLNIKNEIEKVKTMKMLSVNELSLKRNTHNIAMEEIKDAKSVVKAEAIYDIQTSNNFKIPYHAYKYFKTIDRAKTDNVVQCLKELMLSEHLVDEELEIIVGAQSDDIAKILYDVAKKIIGSDKYSKYFDIYIDDLKVIARTENIEIARELAKVATSLDSLKSHKHSNQMRMISSINDVQKAKIFVNVALNEKGTYDELDVIMYNAQSYVDENGYDTELPSNIFKINKKHNNKK